MTQARLGLLIGVSTWSEVRQQLGVVYKILKELI